VAHQPPQISRRIQGLPPKEEIRNNSPLPPQRRQLDPSDTFLPVGQTEIIDINPPEVNASEPEEVTIEDLGAREFTPHFNPMLPGTFPFPVIQVPPPRSNLADSIPLHWVTMDDTPPVSGSGAHATPTSTIVSGGIFPPGMSNQMMGVIQSTIVASTNNIALLVVGPTQISSATASFSSTTNTFSYRMSSMDVLNMHWLVLSQASQSLNVGAGALHLLTKPFLGAEDTFLCQPHSSEADLSNILALTLHGDGVPLWVTDLNLLVCHLHRPVHTLRWVRE
jgi:hypothetical protein